MKKFSYFLLLLTLILGVCFQPVKACDIYYEPARKRFRKAKRVFLGEIVKVENLDKENIPEKLSNKFKFTTERLTFKIIKSWKGNNKNQIVVYSTFYCSCPSRLYEFVIGNQFLVFADSDEYFDVCERFSIQMNSRYAQGMHIQKEIERLDKFLFPTWARIYPF